MIFEFKESIAHLLKKRNSPRLGGGYGQVMWNTNVDNVDNSVERFYY